MIIIKKGTLKRIEKWEPSSFYITMDFDRTITVNNHSTWEALSYTSLLPEEYDKKRESLYDYYRPIETDENIDLHIKNKLMNEWWMKHIDLFIKYELSESIIKQIVGKSKSIIFRKGAKNFFRRMHRKGVPIIIMSAGIGNIIEEFLIVNSCNYDNIYILSNFLQFENGKAIGIRNYIIHSLNKDEVLLPNEVKVKLQNREHIILFGDLISDIKMIPVEKREEALKIGFLETKVTENKAFYEENFDLVCTNNTSFKKILKYIKII